MQESGKQVRCSQASEVRFTVESGLHLKLAISPVPDRLVDRIPKQMSELQRRCLSDPFRGGGALAFLACISIRARCGRGRFLPSCALRLQRSLEKVEPGTPRWGRKRRLRRLRRPLQCSSPAAALTTPP